MEAVAGAKIKPPRKWNSERYPKAITVRVTQDEHRRIGEWAARASLSASRYLVRRGLSERLPPLRDAYPPSPEDRRQIEFLVSELRRVGGNLNQLAKRSNRARLLGGHGPAQDQVERAASQAGALLRILKNRL